MSSFFISLSSGLASFLDGLRGTDWPARLSRLELPALSVDLLQSIALGIALAACAGLRAWLPLFAVGLSVRFGVLPLGDSFLFLGSNTALTVFLIATIVELIADKIPVVDHALDTLSTFLKPVAGMVLAASVLWTVDDPIVALALGAMVGTPASLLPHTAKATVRGVLSPITAGLAAPILSVIEDVIAFGLVALAILAPLVVAAGVVLFALVTGRFVRKRMTPNPRTTRTPPTAVTA
ncbi:MAG: DUF4126 domain-containing protein [Vicinamibacteria bacterium]|nr:DUF4126 domain-containing protein [Vicinamibacteria bacterium]